MFDKFKSVLRNETAFQGTVLILVAVSSFGLGRLVPYLDDGKGAGPALVQMAESTTLTSLDGVRNIAIVSEEKGVSASEPVVNPMQTRGQIVASKNGTKYHLVSCTSADQIKEENKIFFNTREEAEAAGFAPASTCKELFQ